MRTSIAVAALISLFTVSLASAGERESRWLDVRVFPIGALLGEYMGDANFALAPYLSVGIIGYTANVDISGAKAKGSGYGGRVTLHFSGERFSQGWILSGYYYKLGKMDFQQTSSLSGATLTGSVSNPSESGVVLGKMWMWQSGFNLTFAGGIRNISGPSNLHLSNASGSSTMDIPYAGTGARLEFAMGWAF